MPVASTATELGLVELVGELGRVAGSVGFGRIDMVEGRRVGIKSREVYECPAALALIMAHADLEGLTLERDVAHEKARLEPRFAELDLRRHVVLAPAPGALGIHGVDPALGDRRGPAALQPGRGSRGRRPPQPCTVSTSTTLRPTTRPTPSATRTPRASFACSASGPDLVGPPGRRRVTLWAKPDGRLLRPSALMAFTASLLVRQAACGPSDVRGSVAHVHGLLRAGILTVGRDRRHWSTLLAAGGR